MVTSSDLLSVLLHIVRAMWSVAPLFPPDCVRAWDNCNIKGSLDMQFACILTDLETRNTTEMRNSLWPRLAIVNFAGSQVQDKWRHWRGKEVFYLSLLQACSKLLTGSMKAVRGGSSSSISSIHFSSFSTWLALKVVRAAQVRDITWHHMTLLVMLENKLSMGGSIMSTFENSSIIRQSPTFILPSFFSVATFRGVAMWEPISWSTHWI